MSKKIILIALAVIVIVAAGYVIYQKVAAKPPSPVNKPAAPAVSVDPKNAGYFIDGQTYELTNGQNVTDIPATEGVVVTRYFGNEVKADLNGDGIEDAAFVLTQDPGGSGTFYYAAADVSTKDGFKGTNAILLGDRIAPQSTEFANGLVVVNYADRKPNEPITTAPSVGVSRYFTVAGGLLIEIKK
jgi:hypothetical protein